MDTAQIAETETDTVTHWGCQFIIDLPGTPNDGKVYSTRWDPTYGGHHFEPYTEAEARADVRRPEKGFRKVLVTRTETTTVVTTHWKEVTP